mgnify:CR=1 FL=1
MDTKTRAELVRAIRVDNYEAKQRRQGVRATSAFPQPNFRSESADQFIRRTEEGGDSGPAEAAARWDRRRNKLRGRARRGVRAAPRWGDGRHRDYTYDYTGLAAHNRSFPERVARELPDNYTRPGK